MLLPRMTTKVRLLGRPRLEAAGSFNPQPRGIKQWAVLAWIALAGRPVSRQELANDLFGSAVDGYGALRWSLADLRRSLQLPESLRGNPVSLSPNDVWIDIWALADGSLPTAEIGPGLLEGVEVPSGPAFAIWLQLARQSCAARSAELLRSRADELLASGNTAEANFIASRAFCIDPVNETAQAQFLRSLIAAGHLAQSTLQLVAADPTGPERHRDGRARVDSSQALIAGTAPSD